MNAMMKKLPGFAALSVAGLMLFSCSNEVKEANYEVVPMPQEIAVQNTASPFILKNGTPIFYPEGNEKMQKNAEFLASYVKDLTGLVLPVKAGAEGKGILLQVGAVGENPEGYQMKVNADQVVITGASEAGVFYGIQTLRKSLPVAEGADIALPAAEINDFPRFAYRGAMLDVSRHFFPVDSVKRYIDMLALHNINRFHWHLSEDQGWRIEIKSYPKLIEVGSKRAETVIGHNSGKYDGIPYSGHYTQEEAKEIVKYAADRHITVIPEIDMPGHMQAALAAYPNLGCTGGPYEVWKIWGVSEDVLCAGNDEVLKFIEDVLGEIIQIFPSEYIHVGGDECPKVRWAKCPKCQARIKQLGIKADKNHTAEEKLQSFIISHAEKFLNKHGRQIIGWDEILEGGLAPNATVMSWRGEGGGIEAAKQKHDVIMSPNTYLYFDYYQSKDVEQEPEAIGGYLPMERVYSYEPMPAALTPEEQKYIKGVQANLWTEYIPTYSQVEYMELPRMAALADIQWTSPKHKNYDAFLQRLVRLVKHYDVYKYNYATHVFDVTAKFAPNAETGTVDVTLSTIDNCPVYYTLDGTDPTSASQLYTEPVKVNTNCTFKAMAIRPTGHSRIVKEDIAFSKSTSKKIEAIQPVNKQYEFEGISTLVDGLKGNRNYKTGRWIAFYKNDLEAVIDLGQATDLSKVTLTTNVEKGDWVFDARAIKISVSEDGKNFQEVAAEKYPAMTEKDPNQLYEHVLSFDPVKARYLKVWAQPEHSLPAWHGGKGHPAFLFVDEITVE